MFAIRVGESGSIADNLTIEYQRVALHIGRANTQEIMIPSMPEQYRYSLPVKAGDQRQIGELTGAACATLVAEMAERHGGPVVLIAPDMQNALRLNDEIRQFTDSMVAGLADWETLPYDSFSPHQDIISSRLATLYQLPTMERGVLIIPVSTLMAEELENEENEDEIVLLENGEADLDEVFTTAVVLSMDMQNLCSEDCKGLCSGCGVNLNEEPCRCKQEVDPRLAALAQLLDKKD